MATDSKGIGKMLAEVIAPLIELDGGELYLVSANETEVKLHLAGIWSGSPAADMAGSKILEPAIRAVYPKAKLELSAGWVIPDDAEKVTPKTG